MVGISQDEVGAGTFPDKLQLTPREKGIHPVVSVSNIRHYTPNDIPEWPNDPCPGPDVIDGHEEYKAERILNSKFRRGCLTYLVKFKGWPHSNNEWLPATSLEHSEELIANFHHLHPLAVGKSSPPQLQPWHTLRRSALRRG